MIELFPCNQKMDFELPEDCVEARIVAIFKRDLLEREYIITVCDAVGNVENSSPISGLSWSSNLQSAFVYISELPQGKMYVSPLFEVSGKTSTVRVECKSWKSNGTSPELSLDGFALEVFLKLPDSAKEGYRMFIPGKKV